MKTASLLCPLLLASFACAQTVDTPAETPDPASPIKVGDVTLTGTLRDRVYVWNWFQAATGANQYAYSGNYLRLNLAESFSAWDWDAEFTVPFLLGLPATAVDAAPQGALGLGANYYSANGNRRNPAMIFPRQWYVRFHGLGGSDASKLQVGRFLFKDGSELTPRSTTLATLKRDRVSERLLGDFGFSDVGRSFDGVHFSSTTSSSGVTFVAAVPTRGVFQVDGWGWNRVGFGYAAYAHDWGTGRPTFLRAGIRRLASHSENRQSPHRRPQIRHGKYSDRYVRRPQPARFHHETRRVRPGRMGCSPDRAQDGVSGEGGRRIGDNGTCGNPNTANITWTTSQLVNKDYRARWLPRTLG
jgi:hypothetical protein